MVVTGADHVNDRNIKFNCCGSIDMILFGLLISDVGYASVSLMALRFLVMGALGGY